MGEYDGLRESSSLPLLSRFENLGFDGNRALYTLVPETLTVPMMLAARTAPMILHSASRTKRGQQVSLALEVDAVGYIEEFLQESPVPTIWLTEDETEIKAPAISHIRLMAKITAISKGHTNTPSPLTTPVDVACAVLLAGDQCTDLTIQDNNSPDTAPWERYRPITSLTMRLQP